MTEAEQQYELLKNLTVLAEKTKSNSISHSGKLAVYFTLETFCYLIFFILLCAAFYLPDYLSFKLNPDPEISLSITSRNFKTAMLLLKIFFLFTSLFPLIVGFLIRSSRKKSQKLYEAYVMINNTIRLITRPLKENATNTKF